MIAASMTHSAVSHIYRVKTQATAERFLELSLLIGGNSLDEHLGAELKFSFSTKDGEFLIVRGVLESRCRGKYAIRILERLFQA